MKGLLFFFLLLSYSLRAQEPIVTQNYIDFVKNLDTFNRKLLGCPLDLDYITKEDCHPARGVVDMKLWKKLKGLAEKIFIDAPKKIDKSLPHQSK